ncbi:MAG: hypothetical protein ACLGGO_35045, partial [Coleofasciculus sp.]
QQANRGAEWLSNTPLARQGREALGWAGQQVNRGAEWVSNTPLGQQGRRFLDWGNQQAERGARWWAEQQELAQQVARQWNLPDARIPALTTPNGRLPNVETPNGRTPNVDTPNTRPRTPDVETPNGRTPNVDTPNPAKVEPEAPAKPPVAEETAPAKSPVSEETTPNGRSTHMDEPEVEPGVVAEKPTTDGEHKIKVTKEGEVLLCSDCNLLRNEYAEELKLADTDPDIAKIKQELDAADKITNPADKVKAEAEIQQKLNEVRKARLADLQKSIGLSDEATRILQENQVKPSLVEELVEKGLKPDDVALYAKVPHGLEIFKGLLDKQIQPHIAEKVVSLAERNGVLEQVNALVSQGNLRNPTKLRGILVALNTGDRGMLNELNIASDLAKNNHEVELATQGDIVDFGKRGDPSPAKEVIQAKEVTSGKIVEDGQVDAFTKNLQGAEKQLAGKSTKGKLKKTEIPKPEFTRVADISIVNPDNPLFNANRATLSEAINAALRRDLIPEGTPVVQRVRIRTNGRVEVFEAPDFL